MPTSDGLGSDESRDMVVLNEETEEVDKSEKSRSTMIITKMRRMINSDGKLIS